MDDEPVANLCSEAQLTSIVQPAPRKGRYMANRMFHALAEWHDGEWRAVTDEIEGCRFTATVESNVSDPAHREALEPIEEQLSVALLKQLDQALGFPRQQTGMIVSCVGHS